MVTNCKNCGLPIFHGAAGYAGAQCRCGFSAKPNYDHNALTELLKERDQLRAENADMHEALADSLLDTHTAKLERDALREQLTESQANDRCAMAYLADVRAVVGGTDFVCMVHNVTQMKQQLDEARELLRKAAMHVRPTCSDLYAGLDAWLEANKP